MCTYSWVTIVGPDGRFRFSGVQVDVDVHLAWGHVHFGAVASGSAVFADAYAVDVHRDLFGIVWCDVGRHGAEGADDAAPVRIVAGDGAFEQIGRCDRATACQSGFFGGRAGNFDTDVMACAFAVADDLASERGGGLGTSSLNSSGSGSMPDAPEASSNTVSLVDMQPSTSMRLNDISTPAFKAA